MQENANPSLVYSSSEIGSNAMEKRAAVLKKKEMLKRYSRGSLSMAIFLGVNANPINFAIKAISSRFRTYAPNTNDSIKVIVSNLAHAIMNPKNPINARVASMRSFIGQN